MLAFSPHLQEMFTELREKKKKYNGAGKTFEILESTL